MYEERLVSHSPDKRSYQSIGGLVGWGDDGGARKWWSNIIWGLGEISEEAVMENPEWFHICLPQTCAL